MAKVVKLSLHNFRKFGDYTCDFGKTDLVCLIGRGDSGKSTILDALSYVLSPSWTLSFSDYDFHNCNTAEPLRIRAVVVGFPDALVRDDKYGLDVCGYNSTSGALGEPGAEGLDDALVIELTVDESLEPKWEVVNVAAGTRKSMSGKDRALLHAYMVSDYAQRHFAWANGSPLNAMTRAEGGELNQSALVEIGRGVRKISDEVDYGDFGRLFDDIRDTAAELGLDTGTLHPAFDMRQLPVRDGAICLHNESKLPVRLSGKGSRRLLSVAIQIAASGDSAITMLDEVEQGLEPDRVRSFVHQLKRPTAGQMFLTTHSANVLVEMDAASVFLVCGGEAPRRLDETVQKCIRATPEALFGKRVLLCEGETEYGFCRALDAFNIAKGRRSFAQSGTVAVVGGGSEFSRYADFYLDLGMELLLFCDADDRAENAEKERLRERGATIATWNDGESIEQAIFGEAPAGLVHELLKYAVESRFEDEEMARTAIKDSVQSKCPTSDVSDLFGAEEYGPDVRSAIGLSAKGSSNRKGWYKTVTAGEDVGRIVCRNYTKLLESGQLLKVISEISEWAIHD